MKIHELLNPPTLESLLNDATVALQSVDWAIVDDLSPEAERSAYALSNAEGKIFEAWKLDRGSALECWFENSRHGIPGVVPDFIIRRAINERIDWQ